MTEPRTSLPQRNWWQRQRGWLLGAIVFGAWALYMPYREARNGDQREHPTSPITVATGTWAHYEGARWRLLGVEERRATRHLRDDARVLVARFELTPDAGMTARELDRCDGRLSDPQGRHWDADDSGRLGAKGNLPTSCGSGIGHAPDFRPVEAKPGQPWQFEQIYQVPRSIDPRSLTPEIVMRWPRHSPVGGFLRFRR